MITQGAFVEKYIFSIRSGNWIPGFIYFITNNLSFDQLFGLLET
jgi:hypothetical protein